MPGCLDSRVALIEASQNPDGGWGYFPGKTSWLEPTVYALLALVGDAGRERAFARGWALMRSWQLPEGAWRPCAEVEEAHWVTSLALTLHARVGVFDQPFERGVAWLAAQTAAEGRPIARMAHVLRPTLVEFDATLTGWPWQPGGSSWIEPTAHALMALKHACKTGSRPDLARRVSQGERMLLDRRCADGGWNYGNRRVLGRDLPSYPETTALALLALAGNGSVDWDRALAQAERQWRETSSPLARAWLSLCLVRHGALPPPLDTGARDLNPQPPTHDPQQANVLLWALEAMAANRVLA